MRGSVTKVDNHDHPPVPIGIVATQVVAEVRHQAAKAVEKPRQIFQQHIAGIPNASALTLLQLSKSSLPSYRE